MDNSKDKKTEKEIVQDLKEVHDHINSDPNKSDQSEELDPAINNLSEQVKGSDADSDQTLANGSDESKKEEQNQGSDAAKA